MIVTLDGPAGSGKSTVARAAAGELGFRFLNTGAMYRAVGLLCERAGADLDDPAACGRVAEDAAVRFEGDRVIAGGHDLTGDLPNAGPAASAVARHPPVRAAMVELQRAVGAAGTRSHGGVVTEGRDQGTVVFPDAELKIFLTADPRDRAERRRRELAEAGRPATFEAVLAEVLARDERDETRPTAPLVAAPDAVRCDTTGRPVEDVVAEVVRLARGRQHAVTL